MTNDREHSRSVEWQLVATIEYSPLAKHDPERYSDPRLRGDDDGRGGGAVSQYYRSAVRALKRQGAIVASQSQVWHGPRRKAAFHEAE